LVQEGLRLGVVVWAEGSTVKFRVNEGLKVELGQLVKIEDVGVKYAARVYGFKPEALLTPVEVARISFKKERGEEVEFFDKPLRYYDTALATVVAQIDEDGEQHGPTSLPRLFSSVEALTGEDLEQLNLGTGDIPVGTVRVGHKATVKTVAINGVNAFPHHILVCSITGGGKTNFGKVLAWSVMKAQDPAYSMIIVDTESEYFDGGDPNHLGLVASPSADKKLFYVTGEVKTPCRRSYTFTYDGFKYERSVAVHPLEVAWEALHPEDFIQTGEFTPPQEALLWLVWHNYGDGWLSWLLEADLEELYRELGRRVQKSTIGVTKRKLRYMLGDKHVFKPGPCETDLIGSVLSAISKGMVVLIDMPNASDEQEKLLTVVIARRIFKYYEATRKRDSEAWVKLPTVLLMVEEAHRYLSKTALQGNGVKRENVFSIISKRGRKYKVGLCCITQMPGELDEPIIRQQLTKVILPLPTKPDYVKVIHYSPYLDDAAQEIKALDRGEALLVSPPSGIKFAVPVKIYSFEELVKNELKEDLNRVKSTTTTITTR